MKLTYKGRKCCMGKRGGIYLHLKGGGKRYLTKKQRRDVKGNIKVHKLKIKPTRITKGCGLLPKKKKKKKSHIVRNVLLGLGAVGTAALGIQAARIAKGGIGQTIGRNIANRPKFKPAGGRWF